MRRHFSSEEEFAAAQAESFVSGARSAGGVQREGADAVWGRRVVAQVSGEDGRCQAAVCRTGSVGRVALPSGGLPAVHALWPHPGPGAAMPSGRSARRPRRVAGFGPACGAFASFAFALPAPLHEAGSQAGPGGEPRTAAGDAPEARDGDAGSGFVDRLDSRQSRRRGFRVQPQAPRGEVVLRGAGVLGRDAGHFGSATAPRQRGDAVGKADDGHVSRGAPGSAQEHSPPAAAGRLGLL